MILVACALTDVSYRGPGPHQELLVAGSMAHLGSSWPPGSGTTQVAHIVSHLKQGSLLGYWEQQREIGTYFPLLPSLTVTPSERKQHVTG